MFQLEDDDELFNIPTSPTLAKQSPVRGPQSMMMDNKDLPTNTKSQVVHSKDLQPVDDSELVTIFKIHKRLSYIWKETITFVVEFAQKVFFSVQGKYEMFKSYQWSGWSQLVKCADSSKA